MLIYLNNTKIKTNNVIDGKANKSIKTIRKSESLEWSL